MRSLTMLSLLAIMACASENTATTATPPVPLVPLATVQAEMHANPRALNRVKDTAAFQRGLQMIPNKAARQDVMDAFTGGGETVLELAPGSPLFRELKKAAGKDK